MYIGEFNSHNSDWGYDQNDDNGEVLQEWIALHNLELNYNAKDMGTFRSARWRKDYTPDLSITSRNTLDGPTIATRLILGDFPHSQHRPVLLEYGLKVPLIRSLPNPRWNFRKAKWVEYANELDHVIQWIPPTVNCYERFIGAVKGTAYKHVPRGFRKQFIQSWDESCSELFEEFQKTKSNNDADNLISALNTKRKQRWQETTEKMDFKHSSHKAWGLLKRMGAVNQGSMKQHTINPNQVATRLTGMSKLAMDKEQARIIKSELRHRKKTLEPHTSLGADFSLEECFNALRKTKINKA